MAFMAASWGACTGAGSVISSGSVIPNLMGAGWWRLVIE
jgi:hypothetical protein